MRRRRRERGVLRRRARPLGGGRVLDFGEVIGYGRPERPTFWLGPLTTGEPNREVALAFEAPDRAAVRAFFDAAVARGAEVLHEPRVWPEYHPGYYGAFVRDPDGNNVEAVCHRPGVTRRSPETVGAAGPVGQANRSVGSNFGNSRTHWKYRRRLRSAPTNVPSLNFMRASARVSSWRRKSARVSC